MLWVGIGGFHGLGGLFHISDSLIFVCTVISGTNSIRISPGWNCTPPVQGGAKGSGMVLGSGAELCSHPMRNQEH